MFLLLTMLTDIIIGSLTLWIVAKITRNNLSYLMTLALTVVGAVIGASPFVGFVWAPITLLLILDKVFKIRWFPNGIILLIAAMAVTAVVRFIVAIVGGFAFN